MAIFKLEEFYPDYRKKLFGGDDITNLDVYASRTDKKISPKQDALVDEKGLSIIWLSI
ncbi:hypothetical protein [Argonema galeatum]|uniref:hypothetical protein n=1 Tax=Argonema galeatum TaxID=2942762 RepID=UPI0020123367|nr:hypothetical protein [Argonema galeatum]MCL1464919.1 hypothetical protein [Argonema galeatum A003/A1]